MSRRSRRSQPSAKAEPAPTQRGHARRIARAGSVVRIPLRTQVTDILREEITTKHKPGDRLETEAVLSQRLGVSLLTLREALGVLAHEGLVVRQQGRGTFVATAAKSAATGSVAVFIDLDISDPASSPYFLRLAQRLRGEFLEAGHGARLYLGHAPSGGRTPTEPTCQEFLDDVRNGLISAVICLATPAYPVMLSETRRLNIPIIGGGDDFPYAIELDRPGQVDQVVAAVRDRHRIGQITWDSEGSAIVQRFRRRVAEHGMSIPDGAIQSGLHPSMPDAGAELTRRVLRAAPDIDALYISDECYRESACIALIQAGRIPGQDFQVICAGNRGVLPDPRLACTLVEFDLDETVAVHRRIMEALLAGQREVPAMTLVPARTRRITG